jgi:hypothetical protein
MESRLQVAVAAVQVLLVLREHLVWVAMVVTVQQIPLLEHL